MLLRLCWLLWLASPALAYAQNVPQLFREAKNAYQNKDFQTFLRLCQKLDSLRPMHPVVLQELAKGYAMTGQKARAIESLRRLVLIDASPEIAADSAFLSLQSEDGFHRLQGEIAQASKPVQNSEVAFKIAEKDLHLESVAYNPKSNTFYFGSVHKRKIIQIDAKGNRSDFSTDARLWAVLGMQVDAKRQVLWVVSSAAPEMLDFDKKDEGKSKVLKFNLKTRKLLAEYTLDDSKAHFFGDLLLSSDGTVYVSDSGSPALYQIKPQENRLTLLKETGLRSLQGIALDRQEKTLFIADYALGLYALDLPTNTLTPLQMPSDVSAKGTDGLYFWNGSLMAIQNGIKPKRVMQFFLHSNQKEITHFKVLEANNPFFDEPTLGVLVGKTFYYVANSSWNAYKDGVLQTDGLQDIVILKMALE